MRSALEDRGTCSAQQQFPDDEGHADAFRLAMRSIAATVFVVTLSETDRRYGITATAVSSLSLEPLSVLVCINRNASFHPIIGRADRFCLNALREDQQAIATQFGSSKGASERFQTGVWNLLGGLPALDDAQANLVCRKVRQEDFGTHTIFIGEVERVRSASDARPLVYCDGLYHSGLGSRA